MAHCIQQRGTRVRQGLCRHLDKQWGAGPFDPSLSNIWGEGRWGGQLKGGHTPQRPCAKHFPCSRSSRPPHRPRAITTPHPPGLRQLSRLQGRLLLRQTRPRACCEMPWQRLRAWGQQGGHNRTSTATSVRWHQGECQARFHERTFS